MKIKLYSILALFMILFASCDCKLKEDVGFRKPNNGNIYVVAHRGVHNNIPENTLAAYQKAIDLGCDFIEVDLRKTKDGAFVSVHNQTIDAYVDGVSGKVSDFTLAELKQLNIGKRVGVQWENERIPTFEEILELCQGKIGIYLDLKEIYVEELVAIIKKYEMEKDVIWYVYASEVAVVKAIQDNCANCFPMPDPGPKENIDLLVEAAHPKLIATDMGELNAAYMDIAKGHNLKVIVDEKKGTPEEWDQILSWKTDGIQTDRPEALIKYLRSKD